MNILYKPVILLALVETSNAAPTDAEPQTAAGQVIDNFVTTSA